MTLSPQVPWVEASGPVVGQSGLWGDRRWDACLVVGVARWEGSGCYGESLPHALAGAASEALAPVW